MSDDDVGPYLLGRHARQIQPVNGTAKTHGDDVYFEFMLGNNGIELRIELPGQRLYEGPVWLPDLTVCSINGAGEFDNCATGEAFAACLEAEASAIRAMVRRNVTNDVLFEALHRERED